MTIDGKSYAVEPYCIEVNHTKSEPVLCEWAKPKVLIGDCEGDGHQIVKVIIGKKSINCGCRELEVKRLRIRCGKSLSYRKRQIPIPIPKHTRLPISLGCPKTVKYTYGDCLRGRQLERVLIFQPISSHKRRDERSSTEETKCEQVVLYQRKIPCACTEKPKILQKCLSGNRLQVEEITPVFNDTSRTCQKESQKKFYPIGKILFNLICLLRVSTLTSSAATVCPRTKKITSKCGGEETGFTAVETLTTWKHVDCECVPKVVEKSFVCNCSAKYAPRSSTACKDNRRLQTVTASWVLKGHDCVPQESHFTRDIGKNFK